MTTLRPGSSARPSSGLRTAYGLIAGQGNSLTRNPEVTLRPAVMQEGMRGMNTGAPGTSYGPGRLVQDRSYCIGLLRPKVAELTAEIERLRADEDQIHRNGAMLGQLNQKQKSLTDEIQGLKGTMSDVNFAVERFNTLDTETINNQAVSLRQANSEQRRVVDKCFLTVKEMDGQTRGIVNSLEQEISSLEQKLKGQDVGLYRASRTEAYSTSDSVLQQTHELRSLLSRREYLMSSLLQDPDKKRAASFLLDILKKRQQRDDMAKECSISIDEERQMLIRQAKATASDIDVLQRQIAEAKDGIQEVKGRINQANEDMNEYSGENARKFQELQEKDREMQEFIDTFLEKEKEELSKIKVVEQSIVEILERVSRAHILKQQMPQENTPQMLENISAELSERESQFKNAKVTHQRLENELVERKNELAKVASLDEKITTELQVLAQKMVEQKQDVTRYSDIEGLRQSIEQRKKSLTARKGFLLKQRDNSKQQIHLLTNEFEGKKARLSESDVHNSLTALELKLRLVWQTAFSLEEFVRLKNKETQFQCTKADCMRITDECNNILKDPRRFEAATGVTIVGK